MPDFKTAVPQLVHDRFFDGTMLSSGWAARSGGGVYSEFEDMHGGADAKVWRQKFSASDFTISTADDANETVVDAYVMTRSGNAVTQHDVKVSGTTKLTIDSSGITVPGTVTLTSAAPMLNVGSAAISTGTATLQIGEGRTDSGTSLIDLVGDTTYADYGLRIIRDGTGANANSRITHRGTGDLRIVTQEAAPLDLYTSDTHRVRVSSGGDVLPAVTESLDLGSPTFEWDNIYTQNAVTVSDEREKREIEDLAFGTDFIRALRPRSYLYRDKTVQQAYRDADGEDRTRDVEITHSRRHFGLVAQEVKAALDDLGVSTSDFAGFVDASVNGGPDKLMLRYMQFIPVIIKALQEIDARVAELEGA